MRSSRPGSFVNSYGRVILDNPLYDFIGKPPLPIPHAVIPRHMDNGTIMTELCMQ